MQRRTTGVPTRSRIRTRCAACRRSTAPCATRSTTCARVLDIELNSATDNPLVFPGGGVAEPTPSRPGGGLVISGGNFHGEPIALALDFAKLALAETRAPSASAGPRSSLDPASTAGCRPFLAAGSGLDSGMMISSTPPPPSRPRTRCWPTRRRPTPSRRPRTRRTTSRWARSPPRHARTVLEHVERILAIELLCAAQALDLRLDLQPGTPPGAGVAEAHARIRSVIRRLEGDRQPGPDIEAASRLVRDGALVDLAEPPASVGTSWLGPDPR